MNSDISATVSFKGSSPTFGSHCYIDSAARIIGDVVLGDDVSIWPMTVLRGDVHQIRIGAQTNIQDGCVLHVTHAGPFSGDGYPLHIGQQVTVGHGVILHACTIGDRCLIGMGAIIMDGAIIESDVVIGAGTLVPPGKRIKSGFLYLGHPAQAIRPLHEKEYQRIIYSAEHYVRLKNQYLADRSAEA